MATKVNEILQFAQQADGDAILTQSSYDADAQRVIGHQPGTEARAELENKVLKQTSAMSAGLAQFILEHQDDSITDSMTPAAIATALGSAVAAVAGTVAPQLQDASETQKGIIQLASQAEVDAGADSAKAVTSSTLQAKINAIPVSTFPAYVFNYYRNGYQEFPSGLIIAWSEKSKSANFVNGEYMLDLGLPAITPSYACTWRVAMAFEKSLTFKFMQRMSSDADTFTVKCESAGTTGVYMSYFIVYLGYKTVTP